MNELTYVYATAAVIVGVFAFQVLTRRFDPFAPIWLFLVGYAQVYVDPGDLATTTGRWASGASSWSPRRTSGRSGRWPGSWWSITSARAGRSRGSCRRRPGRGRSAPSQLLSPVLIVWGLLCAGHRAPGLDDDRASTSAEAALLLSFPFVMLVAGRPPDRHRAGSRRGPGRRFLAAGSAVVAGLHAHLDVQRQAVALADRASCRASAPSTSPG